MKDTTKILYYIILLVIFIFVIIQLNTYKNFNKAIKTLEETRKNLSSIKDSIHFTKITIENILERIKQNENEIKILKTQREILELQEKQRYAKSIDEINFYRKEIKKKEIIKDSLQTIAKKFEP